MWLCRGRLPLHCLGIMMVVEGQDAKGCSIPSTVKLTAYILPGTNKNKYIQTCTNRAHSAANHSHMTKCDM